MGGSTMFDNMAGNSRYDFDVLEDSFARLKNASVIVADYKLLRTDFPVLADKTSCEIDAWLLSNFAYISEGQVAR